MQIEQETTPRPRFRFGILAKLLAGFLILTIVPIMLSGFFGVRAVENTGTSAISNMETMGDSILNSNEIMKQSVVEASVDRLDRKSTLSIETRTVDCANHVADLLYSVDNTVRSLGLVPRTPEDYLRFSQACQRRILVPAEYKWDDESEQWVSTRPPGQPEEKPARLKENSKAWNYNPVLPYEYVWMPLFREVTFYDLDGNEQVKIENDEISSDLRNISEVKNTFCKAETYYKESETLQPGELYVSPVIATYEPFWGGKPGTFNPNEHPDLDPRDFGYAGLENPLGKRSDGLIRWVYPIYQGQEKIGYVTAAMDQRHLQECVEHIHPTDARYTELHDPGSGNYAFIWDANHRSVAHPRHYFQCGFDPETGEEIPAWTGKTKLEQLKAGRVPLDGRYLDFAPQCQGWARITEDGGNGSFQILWSGLYKLTTVASIPYHTGKNYESSRGFGYVTIGANVDDFHRDALLTGDQISQDIAAQRDAVNASLADSMDQLGQAKQGSTNLLIGLVCGAAAVAIIASVFVAMGITNPIKRLSKAAAGIANGDLDQRVEIESGNELGDLAATFNSMAEHVREVDQMKSEFVTVASHELRTPIHGMTMGVSAILEGYCGDVSEEVTEDLLVVNEGITRLNRLIGNLLDLSRIESGKIEINDTYLYMDDVVQIAVSEVSELARSNRHEIITTIDDKGPVNGDRDRLTQVVVNLLGNSIKYTPDGGTILVHLHSDGTHVTVSVADNGYGIPQDVHEKVFERFYQAHCPSTKQVGGTGLGLSITQGLVREHGGSIELISPLAPEYPGLTFDDELRQGTRFVIVLPQAVVSDEHRHDKNKEECLS